MQANTSTASLMAMGSIIGKMEVFIKVILNMELGTDTEFGKIKNKFIKETIDQTKRKVLEFINGLANKFIKESSEKISEKDMASFTRLSDKIKK